MVDGREDRAGEGVNTGGTTPLFARTFHTWLCVFVCVSVVSQFLIVLIGFQTANKNHSKSREVAVRVTMYVFTDRYQVQYERTLFLTPSWHQERE